MAAVEHGIGTATFQAVDAGAGQPQRRKERIDVRDGAPADESDRPAEATGKALEHAAQVAGDRSEEHTSELQSLMRISYAVFCLKKKKQCHIVIHTSAHMTEPTALQIPH